MAILYISLQVDFVVVDLHSQVHDLDLMIFA